MSFAVSSAGHVSARYLRAFARQPYYLAVTLVQPVIWLLLFGHVFERVVQLPGFSTASYIGFLAPGIVVMTALFSNGWSGMAYVTDIDRGVLDRFLVAPVRGGSLIGGQLAYAGLLTLLQSLIILGLGWISGASFAGAGPGILACLLATLLLGTAFASYSNALALLLRKQETLIAMVNFLVLPLTFLSVTFMPSALLPGWIRTLSAYNPVDWAVQVSRQCLSGTADWGYVSLHLALLALLAAACAYLSTRAFGAYRRAI